MKTKEEIYVHANAVAIRVGVRKNNDVYGVLIIGASASGKSDLSLRMMESGDKLISDDQTILTKKETETGEILIASAPENLKNKIEIRGVGIVKCQSAEPMKISLIIELVERDKIDRLPELDSAWFLDCEIPLIKIYPFEPSTMAKLRAGLNLILDLPHDCSE